MQNPKTFNYVSINTKLIHFKDTLQNNRHVSRTNRHVSRTKTLAKYILNKYLQMKFHHENTWTTSPMCLDYNPKG